MGKPVTYADFFIDTLFELGYRTCFFLGGGNILHLMDAARRRMSCIAVTHENSAAISAEYFNVAARDSQEKAFALVTAGPGVTNLVSGVAGAWLESRELLVVAGQARTTLLSHGLVRQVGHQEVDGVGIMAPITKTAVQIDRQISAETVREILSVGSNGRKGPVFLEVCLDIAASLIGEQPETVYPRQSGGSESVAEVEGSYVGGVAAEIVAAQRPMILVGQGLDYMKFQELLPILRKMKIPVATSWNAADYIDFDDEIYAGRPNTYGMRWSNLVIQQCDLLLSLGASLGVQQTGFNSEQFVPKGKIIRVDIDRNQLELPPERVVTRLQVDASGLLADLLVHLSESEYETKPEWLDLIADIRSELTTIEIEEPSSSGFSNPARVIRDMSHWAARSSAKVVSCSSGGTYTLMMQCFEQKSGQLLTNNKGLASMGYGLAGAIGTSLASPGSPVLLLEGDGGFAQNISELGTVAHLNLPVKMVIFDNGGYASIRLSQQAFFGGNYLGCDADTGLQLPEWNRLFSAFDIPVKYLEAEVPSADSDVVSLLEREGPAAIVVRVDPELRIVPKIESKVSRDGSIYSAPLHEMSPALSNADKVRYLRHV